MLMGAGFMAKYDYLIIGAGLYGAVFAHEMTKRGKKCLVLEKRQAPGGNIRCEEREGIHVHLYGAHIFHTNNQEVWQFVQQFAEFNQYVNSPIANFRGELYNLPFNMNTFRAMWGIRTPAEAAAKIAEQRTEIKGEPQNLEEQAISLVGRDIYEKLIQGYTEKQWGRKCRDLPAFIIRRLPVRYTYDNNYFNARYQGIPIGGYNKIIEGLLNGIEIRLRGRRLIIRLMTSGIRICMPNMQSWQAGRRICCWAGGWHCTNILIWIRLWNWLWWL